VFISWGDWGEYYPPEINVYDIFTFLYYIYFYGIPLENLRYFPPPV